MLELFKPKYRSVLGIDISSTAIKIVEVSGKEGQRTLEGYGYQLLPPDVMDGHTIKDTDSVSNTIKEVLNRFHLKSKFAILAVPDSSVISKVIQINEGLNESEIEEIVIMEADRYIPFPIDEINIDFEILGPAAKNTAMLDVLMVASRTENVSTRVEAATKAGLQVKVVDVESFAMERIISLMAMDIATNQDLSRKMIAVIDIGAKYANLFVLQGKDVIFTREEEFGNNQLITAIMHHYHASSEEAFKIRNQETPPEDYNEAIVQPFVENLLIHIKRSLQFFYSTNNSSSIDYIVLTGGIAKSFNMTQAVQETLLIPTIIANPFKYFTKSKRLHPEKVDEESSLMMIPCGLALRDGQDT